MKKKPATPAPVLTPEQQLERMKELVRQVITVPKSDMALGKKQQKEKPRRTKRKAP